MSSTDQPSGFDLIAKAVIALDRRQFRFNGGPFFFDLEAYRTVWQPPV